MRDNANMPARGQPGHDTLFKLRPIIELHRTNCEKIYNPKCELRVDEGIIKFKGRLHFHQYMPAKPTRWGVKVWELCESDSGYCLNFEVYTGRDQGAGAGGPGLGERVVRNLTHPYFGQNHQVFCDRLFSGFGRRPTT